MATGDITSVEISPSGAEPYGACADITIEGFTTGKTIDFGSGRGNPLDYDDLASATIVFTITSEGYNSSGTLGTVTRTVYATEIVRQEYPNHTSDEEPAATSIRVALSNFVYADDQDGGAGTSGTDPTVTIAAGAIRNDGDANQLNNAATDLACTNSSGLDYPEVIGRWDRVAGVVTADRVKTDFNMAVRAYHRSGIACVVFDADGQTSANNETATATTRTATQRTGSGLWAEAYHSGDISLTSFTDDELIDLRFRAYPVVGDADSVRDSNDHTTTAEECLGYNKATIVCDKDDDGDLFAVIDASGGNDATGVVSGTLATAEASPYQHIGDAIEDGANVIYLLDGTHEAIGHTFTRRTTNEWVVVTHHPSNSSTAGAIVQVTATRAYDCQRLQYKDVTFTLATTGSWLDGEDAGNFLRLTGIVFDDDTTGAPTVGIGYRSHATYLENCTGDMGEQEWDWERFSSVKINYCFDGCDFGTPATADKNICSSYEFVANKMNGCGGVMVEGDNSGGPVKDNIDCSFNEILDYDSTSLNAIYQIATTSGDDNTIGMAFVGNLIEKTAGTSAAMTLSADSSVADTNHILLWHNTMAGERSNVGYNDLGSTSHPQRNWSQKFNSFRQWNNKDDTDGSGDAARTGSWPVGYGVGFLANNYEQALFPGEYAGFGTVIGSPGYQDDNSYSGDGGSGNGDYTPSVSSALLERIPSGQRVVTIDLYGSIVYDGGDIGAVQLTGPSGSGVTDWIEFTVAATSTPGDQDWTNASNALTSLATAATNDLAVDDTSYTLKLTDVDGALDSIGTPTNIEIRVEATGEDGGTTSLGDENIQLIIGGTLVGDDKSDLAQWQDSYIQTKIYEWDESDIAALSIDASDLQASNFGVALQFLSDGGATALMSVYRVSVRVRYGMGSSTSGSFFY